MLNDDEIVTSEQAESNPVYDETDEDENNNNESSKGPSNADSFSALGTAMEWYEQQSGCCGEEGIYPHLIKFCEEKLKELDPNNKYLGLPKSIVNYSDLPEPERRRIISDLEFRDGMRTPVAEHKNILQNILPGINLKDIKACYNCRQSLSRKSIPNLSKYNGFVYPEIPAYLPTLGLVSERLISARILFMQIRRLRHVHSQFGILGQIINVLVSINTMVNRLPRNVDDDYCVNVHIKWRKIHRTSYLMGLKKESQNIQEANHRVRKPRSYDQWNKFNVEEELEKIDDASKNPSETDESKETIEINKFIPTVGLSLDECERMANLERIKGNEAFKSQDYEEAVLYYTRSISALKTPRTLNNRAQACNCERLTPLSWAPRYVGGREETLAII
ncbi:sperm-associated antigen 1 [Trichonephila clavipes]|nr:sperm-associated antigen 1 [Trichonephila clavipes]